MDHEDEIIETAQALGIPLDAIDFRRLVRGAPMVELFIQWRVLRHTNRARWTQNDFNDLMYLSCAAGYADFVITESQAAGFLNQAAAAVGRQPNAYSTIESCLAALEPRLM